METPILLKFFEEFFRLHYLEKNVDMVSYVYSITQEDLQKRNCN